MMTDLLTPPDQPILDILNPYWDAVAQVPADEITGQYEKRWVPSGYPPMSFLDNIRGTPDASEQIKDWYIKRGRSGLVQKYAWAIPNPAVLVWMIEALDGRPVVEMGAGTGYWAWLLEQLGVDIVAYDAHPPLQGENHYHCRDGVAGNQYVEIKIGGPDVLTNMGNHALFLSWPPYDTDMGAECLAAYPGDMLIEIGEGEWGCTANDAFYQALADWQEVDSGPLVQWSGLHDRITLWRRK